MSELKRLFDLRENYTSEEWAKWRMGIIKHEEFLREEAIKWIKDCKVKVTLHKTEELIDSFMCREGKKEKKFCDSCIKWMNFFNITEQDLV